MMATHRGSIPTSEDDYWLSAATELTPHKSLERLDAHGKYLFGTVTVVGTLLTGFDLVKVSWPGPQGTAALLYPITFAAIGLALAMMGITPRLDRVARADVLSVQGHYNRLIRRRGRFIFWASVSFALSLVSVPLALGASFRHKALGPSLTAKIAGLDDKVTLVAGLSADVPKDGAAEIEVIGYAQANIDPTHASTLSHEVVRSKPGEHVVLSTKVEEVGRYMCFLVRAKVEAPTGAPWRDEVTLTRLNHATPARPATCCKEGRGCGRDVTDRTRRENFRPCCRL